jgi:ornithine cyclodeaminase/alanine dehydrogenase-like protein (mu-crystallin family)
VPLFRWDTGELVALIEADYLGRVRTGAASGVAAKFMSRTDSRVVGMIGTGGQAATQVEAVCAVRPIERVRVFSRNEQKRREFAEKLSERIHLPVEAADSAEKAVRQADIVITMTTASQPVIECGWLARGAHINAAGGNLAQKAEIDAETVRQASVIATDSLAQAKIESGDLVQVFAADAGHWSRVVELSEIVVGHVPGRHSQEDITLFKSNGVAIEDVAVAGKIYELARQRGVGREIPLFEKA